MAQDHYEILQVHPRADSEAISAAYARLRALYDPEQLDGAADELVELARLKRDQIERAYAVLSDPVRRASFDAELTTALPARPAGSVAREPAPQEDLLLDYGPLPPARRAERSRDFDGQPVRFPPADGRAPHASARRPTMLIAFAGLLVLAIAISLVVTAGGQPPAGAQAPAPSATASSFDQFEAQIPALRSAAEQNP